MNSLKFMLDKEERDELLNSLSLQQQEYLKNELKRSKKTAFANVLAKTKGLNTSSDLDLLNQIKSWELIEYIDAGKVTIDLKCECGRPLRYQYIVRNNITNETRKLGINHLVEHTKIPSHIAKEIVRGFSEIDYELDEILYKLKTKWQSNLAIPPGIELTETIQHHLNLNLPLLDKQLSQVHRLIKHLNVKNTNFSHTKVKSDNTFPSDNHIREVINQIKGSIKPLEYSFDENYLTKKQQQFIVAFVETTSEVISARAICELLINLKLTPNKRFSSRKPEIFPYVCMFLEFLSTKGKCIPISKNMDDRTYKPSMQSA